MIRASLIASLFALAACGADGDPVRPSVNSTVTVGSDGIKTSTGVTVQSGPVTVGVGF
ncbi:hypothetical protein [Marivita hallyeonensis]|uniref:Uncharacterized protein n=1 Tax=Marivita hallyeonensis TaxID=996342 RepID=A0A1M5UI58_9RHOB|nr:hypothetical protein [Marivita hallyeonensis]SHH62667.1 hypothetical protein SAMN05443551_2656 [Marivita hallyeonensis]